MTDTDRRPSWRLRLMQAGLYSGFGLFLVGLLTLAGCVGAYDHYVAGAPPEHIQRDHIRAIIATESPVYYRDGKTRVGVFFDAEHRVYVPFDGLPPAYVMAIVAAEDGGYWRHSGLNVKGIGRAMRDNIKAGRVVAGGSTLSQQTAKNLYYRPDRTPKSKWIELTNALRLEANYSKEEILGFYVNQFHVTGNGRGIGIAARHFFDVEVEELTVLQSAFLAGLVKAPSRYDPFRGDKESRVRAVERAHDRTTYVLQRLVDEPAENLAGTPPSGDPAAQRAWTASLAEVEQTRLEAARLLEEGFELPFKRGAFRYDSSAILDEVAHRLDEPPFDEILGQAGIDDPAKAGLVVVTTLDADAQREATYGLWHHLTEVGTWLEGLTAADAVRADARPPRYDPDHPARRHEFRLAEVVGILGDQRKHLEVDLGGHACIIDRDGIVRTALAISRGQAKDRNARVPTAEVDALVAALPVGSVVWVSVREAAEDGAALCDLEIRPELQGAVVVLQDNQIRAMVAGNDNRNFNRAGALRQMGSTWKPLVYHAAMQLGWLPDEELDNARNVFPFSTTWYYPRPDHEPAPVVSMSWAGVNSENLASIWLLYHLTDRLDGDQVRTLAQSLDLARRPDEDDKAYRRRIQEAGVLSTRSRVVEGLFLQARQEVLAGLESTAHPDDRMALSSLLYGWGYGDERKRVNREGPSTRAWKLRALDNNWRYFAERMEPCSDQYGELAEALDAGIPPEPSLVSDLSVWLDGDAIRVACGTIPEGYVAPNAEFMASLPEPTVSEEPDVAAELAMPKGLRRLFGGLPSKTTEEEAAPVGPQLVELESLFIDDRLHLSTLRAIDGAMRRRQLAMELSEERVDLYDPETLYWHQDFRVLLALRYVLSLAEQYGVQQEVPPILSMPLGAAEITLEESASVYGGLVSGRTWTFPGEGRGGVAVQQVPASTLLIAELRDVDGKVLYRAAPEEVRVATPVIGEMTSDILHNVVLHGTGRRAHSAVFVDGGVVPVGGKTGTTNDFRNAAFLGFAPTALDGEFDASDGFVVGAYVGYDDNRPLTSGRIRLAGSSGALPVWISTIQGMAAADLLGEPAGEPVDGRWPLPASSGLHEIAVLPGVGLRPVGELVDGELVVAELPEDGPTVLAPRAAVLSTNDLDFRPLGRPARLAPSTEEALEEEAL